MPTSLVRALSCSISLVAALAGDVRAQSTDPHVDPVEAVAVEIRPTRSSSRLQSLIARIDRRTADSTSVANGAPRLPGAALADSTEDAAVDSVTMAIPPDIAQLFKSREDSVGWARGRVGAQRANGFRVVVDLFQHQLFVIRDDDTLRAASVATALNTTLSFGGRSWRFETPRGVRPVLAKEKDPVWRAPDWHFAEVALENHLAMRSITRGQTIRLRDGSRLLVKGDEVGVISPGQREFTPLALDEHIVFDNTLFVPPFDTKQRQIRGELGAYRLILGNGFLLHGTPYGASIGTSATHGCIRLADADIAWLYENVPAGTKVYIF
jgi:lipoprotein-anchoring transpeptidase ErfK/SrfK